VYCLEQADHGDADVWELRVPADAAFQAGFDAELAGGCVVLSARGELVTTEPSGAPLYRELPAQRQRRQPWRLRAIPYFAWANRQPGPMEVWVPLA
jgi:hypothetical protein